MFEWNLKIKIKNFIKITILMLMFNRKASDSLLFERITPSNISNNLSTIVLGRRYPPNTLKLYSDKLMWRRDSVEFK